MAGLRLWKSDGLCFACECSAPPVSEPLRPATIYWTRCCYRINYEDTQHSEEARQEIIRWIQIWYELFSLVDRV